MSTIAQSNLDLYAIEIARILATAHYGDAIRVDRAVLLYVSEAVDPIAGTVRSEGNHGVYRVSPSSCQCRDFSHRQTPCKHVIAMCLARKTQQIMEHQWYATLDGDTECIATLYAGLVLVQDDADPEPKRVDASRVVLGAPCDNAAHQEVA